MALSYLKGGGPDPFPGVSPHPAKARETVHGWLRATGDLLGLKAWRIDMSAGVPNNDESLAETFFRDSTTEIVTALGPQFFDYAEPRRRATLTHELLHAHFHPVTRYARDAVQGELGTRWETLFEATLGEYEEQAVDALAFAIAPLLPESPAP